MLQRISPNAANEIQLYDPQLAMGGLQKAYEELQEGTFLKASQTE